MKIVLLRKRGKSYDPSQITTLKLWLDATKGLYRDTGTVTPATADADPVGDWRDQSGLGNHLIQATGTKRPTVKVANQAGKNVVRWDAVDDSLTCTLNAAVVQPFTVFCAVKIGVSGEVFMFDSVDGTNRVGLVRGYNGTDMTMDMFGSAPVFGPAYSVAAWKIITILYNGASSVMRINGVTVSTGNVGTTALTSIRLGNYSGESLPLNGDVAEFYAASGDLTSKFAQNESYLNSKWGVY